MRNSRLWSRSPCDLQSLGNHGIVRNRDLHRAGVYKAGRAPHHKFMQRPAFCSTRAPFVQKSSSSVKHAESSNSFSPGATANIAITWPTNDAHKSFQFVTETRDQYQPLEGQACDQLLPCILTGMHDKLLQPKATITSLTFKFQIFSPCKLWFLLGILGRVDRSRWQSLRCCTDGLNFKEPVTE